MGGDFIIREPSTHKKILEDALALPIFTRVGLLDYFLKLIEFNDDITRRFVNKLEHDESIVKFC